jgi:hypothetical protein
MNTPCNTLAFQHPLIAPQISYEIMGDQLFNIFLGYLFNGKGENP